VGQTKVEGTKKPGVKKFQLTHGTGRGLAPGKLTKANFNRPTAPKWQGQKLSHSAKNKNQGGGKKKPNMRVKGWGAKGGM